MNTALHAFHFLQPFWLLLLLALLPMGWLGWRHGSDNAALSRLVDAALLPHLLRGRARRRGVPLLLLAAGWTLATLALAGPTWSRIAQPLYANRAAQVVAISLSQRMLARDVAPSRLDRARFKARDLLAANRDGTNALIAYAGEAFVVAPLTSDADSLNDLLDALSPDTMPVDGDNAAAAITRGAALIHDAQASSGSLVLITDGVDAAGSTAALAAARLAAAAGVRVSVLGVGTPQGGPVPLGTGGFAQDEHGQNVLAQRDDAGLAALAEAGNGRYVPMGDDGADIAALHGELQARPGQVTDPTHSAVSGEQWRDRGPWLLLGLLPLLALAFRRGWLLMLPLIMLPLLPAQADATTWNDLWQRPDQQAATALREGHAKQAQQLARDPALRGAAAYRAGDFKAAAQTLQPLPGAQAQYNLGNALAKAERYQEALAAYDRALKKNPADADAKANRDAVATWLRKQQAKKPQGEKPSTEQEKSGSSKDKNKPSDQHDNTDGKNGKSDGQDGKKDGQNGKKDGQDGKRGQQGQPKPGDAGAPAAVGQTPPSSSSSPAPASSAPASSASTGATPTPAEQAAQRARAEQARKALAQRMDQALKDPSPNNPAKKSAQNATHQLGTLEQGDPQSRLPPELRQALQRVPDDPGALLRRKFELEYRQRHGALPSVDDEP